ncbi:thioesterase family protein [soil metagenome]
MSTFERDTSVVDRGDHWATRLHAEWNIGGNPNGGYALSPVLRVLRGLAGHPDPISVTTQFLRPAAGDADGEVHAEAIRVGRTTGVARGWLVQGGKDRLLTTAVFVDLSEAAGAGPELAPEPVELPPPQECVDRRDLAQGVELPILSRVDVRIEPAHIGAGTADRAVVAGWIRFADGTPPTALALPLFADAFPPSLYPLLGSIGWVPTIELTVHVRRRPAPGWIRARFECDDLHDGRMIESGTLWDSTGAVVARSRQLGLHLDR